MNILAKRTAGLVLTLLTAATAACTVTSVDKYAYDSMDPALPLYPASALWSGDNPAEERNLQCRTNLVSVRDNNYSGNAIESFDEEDAAVRSAELEELPEDGKGDQITFWIAPVSPDPDSEIGTEPWLTMTMESESGKQYILTRTGIRESELTYVIDGEHSEVPLTDIALQHGRGRGQVHFPIPEGFLTTDDPLSYVELEVYGKDFARCIPAEGSPGVPEVIETPTAPPTGMGLPSFLREDEAPVEDAAPAGPSTSFSDGTHLVGADIQPGTYRNSGATGSCYWARLSGFGGTVRDIIANANPRGQSFVTIDASDKAFSSKRCGSWELVE